MLCHYTSREKTDGERYSLFVKIENIKKHGIDNLELKNTINKVLELSISLSRQREWTMKYKR